MKKALEIQALRSAVEHARITESSFDEYDGPSGVRLGSLLRERNRAHALLGGMHANIRAVLDENDALRAKLKTKR